ncbi:hypothetical protein [Microcystis sp. BLCC-F210]|uniref:hypothetical protein n=1 Tax=Microcystis sp. BLCC-F210 TaxID=3342751 RepID=UPI0035C8B1C9
MNYEGGGSGEVGKWGSGEVGKWGNGEWGMGNGEWGMGKWGSGGMGKLSHHPNTLTPPATRTQ